MIYITQLIFIKEGEEKKFLEFESHAIPLMERFNGKIIHRVRPSNDAFVSEESEVPYEIHIISFDSEKDLNEFMSCDERLKFIHLKNESIKSTFLIKGEKM